MAQQEHVQFTDDHLIPRHFVFFYELNLCTCLSFIVWLLVMVMDFPTRQKRSGFGNLAIFLGFDRNRSAARQAQLANFSFCEDCMQRSSSGAGNFCRPEWPLHTASVLKLNPNYVLYTRPCKCTAFGFHYGYLLGQNIAQWATRINRR